MSYEYQRDKKMEPSLTEMVEFAIRTLQQSEKGFVLLVEGMSTHYTVKISLLQNSNVSNNTLKSLRISK